MIPIGFYILFMKSILTIISIEQESGSSVLMEIQGMPGIGSRGTLPAIVDGDDTNAVSKSKGDEADIDEEAGEADPENENPDWDCSSSRIPSRIESRVIELSGIIVSEPNLWKIKIHNIIDAPFLS